MAEPRMEPPDSGSEFPDSNISTKMNAKDLRIVFMGTPEFAVPSLRALVRSGYTSSGSSLLRTNRRDADRNCMKAT